MIENEKKRYGVIFSEFRWPLLIGILSGLYVSFFYVTNNLTMLQGESIILLFLILTSPAIFLIFLVFCIFKILGKVHMVPAFSVAVSVAYMLILLQPAFAEISFVNSLLNIFGGSKDLFAKIIFTAIPAAIISYIFKGDCKRFSFVLGAMIIAVLVARGSGIGAHTAEKSISKWENWKKYENVKLAKKPNIYFIVPDSYASVAYLQDLEIDISNFLNFLKGNQFRIYEDTYSNYQPTTNSLPSLLNMEHHYHTITPYNFTEVSMSGRIVIGGKNNFFRVLANNGYIRQIIHQGPILLLQGNNADYSFPAIDGFTGAKIVLGKIIKRNLLSRVDKRWKDLGSQTVHQEIIANMSTDRAKPTVQYVHMFVPGHSPMVNECDEKEQNNIYMKRIINANKILENLIADIISNDPEAVIILAGDHGPFNLNGCSKEAILKTREQIRDRAGILTAIRWPNDYDGRFDNRVKTSVNTLRFVLASLAENESELLETAVPDDVYVKMIHYRKNNAFFKIVESGIILEEPMNIYIPKHLRTPKKQSNKKELDM